MSLPQRISPTRSGTRPPRKCARSSSPLASSRSGNAVDAAQLFRRLGYECLHVSELGMQRAEDEEILAFARDQGCVVITLDADFHTFVAVWGLSAPSVHQATP